METVTPADWRQIVAKAKEHALAGDSKAREWLGRFLLGNAGLWALVVHEELDEAIQKELDRLEEHYKRKYEKAAG